MKAVEVAKGIFWVGVVDWNIRDFHGYATQYGTTYNAYLVLDEKVALIDTVKEQFAEEMLDAIAGIVDPKRIDLIISNHSEMDHSGALPRLMHRIGEVKPIYCSKMGMKDLSAHFHRQWNYKPVDEGSEISLGRRTLSFFETRMVHWPDSMFTYSKEDRILFSNDAFGQHFASMERFDDQVGDAILPHAKKYFANILLLYSPIILKLLEKIDRLGLRVDTICPDHGLVWRKDPEGIMRLYERWASQIPAAKAVVTYDTMWNSTRRMAEVIAESIAEDGIDVKLLHLRSHHRSDIITELIDARAVAVGSPTLNNGLFPTVSDLLSYMKGLRPLNKLGVAFGSYGWSGEAVKLITKELEAMKFQILDPGLNIWFVPDRNGIEDCRRLGRKIAEAIAAS